MLFLDVGNRANGISYFIETYGISLSFPLHTRLPIPIPLICQVKVSTDVTNNIKVITGGHNGRSWQQEQLVTTVVNWSGVCWCHAFVTRCRHVHLASIGLDEWPGWVVCDRLEETNGFGFEGDGMVVDGWVVGDSVEGEAGAVYWGAEMAAFFDWGGGDGCCEESESADDDCFDHFDGF